jgi:hypothetical protein
MKKVETGQHIGFTGTRKGMARFQYKSVLEWEVWRMLEGFPTFVHHGDCIGADDDFDDIAHAYYAKVIIHPPINSLYRAWCPNFYERRPVKDYSPRNKDIVNESHIMIACPKKMIEEIQSGTWSAIRYARKQGKTIHFFWPDGSKTIEYNEKEL